MLQANVTAEHRAVAAGSRRPEPCVMVIFGATGDLTRRKLMPAIYQMRRAGMLPEDFAIVGVAREGLSTESFRVAIREAMHEFVKEGVDAEVWGALESRIHYVGGELDSAATFDALRDVIAAAGLPADAGKLFYLAVPPDLYETIITRLSTSGVAPRVNRSATRPWVRVVIEKPFGTSLESAQALNQVVRQAFAEHQIYRIDHYLGKETVQNLLVLRFANSIFEPVWNRQHVEHVQITAAESVGVEHRGRYYENAGVIRDMFQNHLLQLLTLTAMEPPVRFNADAVRDEKVKVLQAIRPMAPSELDAMTIRGQYGFGSLDGQAYAGYRQEPNVAPDSGTPTYAAVRFMIDNWRWNGVPFFLRSAKRMPRRATEIAIHFRRPPHLMFSQMLGEEEPVNANVLTIRIQPSEGTSLRFEVKTPGAGAKPSSVMMDFDYSRAFQTVGHEAYETLLLDAMLGEATLFTRSDEVEAAWRVVDPIIEHWDHHKPTNFPNYAAGTWGPASANEWIERFGARWREP